MISENVFHYNQQFDLETGGHLPAFQLHYCTAGNLNADRSNVIWICHALTGNANFTDWWPGMVGPGLAFDTEKYFVICANALGGCYGSTGPLSINPVTGKPYHHDFPEITNRDIVRAFDLLRIDLGINQIEIGTGGSLGGQHILEWGVQNPKLFKNLIVIASNAYHSAWGVAFNESQRMAIENDPTWRESTDAAGIQGMKTARSIALLSYRNYGIYEEKQSDYKESKTDSYKASSYQRYQGEKLAQRFNAYSYWLLSKAMDSHNVGRDREGIEKALSGIKARCLFIGVKSDILFPVEEQIYLAANVRSSALDIIPSHYGHDGFLIEVDKLTQSIRSFHRDEVETYQLN